MVGKIRLLLWLGAARCTALVTTSNRAAMPRRGVALQGWLDAFLPAPMTDEEFEEDRRSRWPEQYAAVLDEWAEPLASDDALLSRLRPLLARNQLTTRALELAYDAERDGWSAEAFHRGCDGRGACVVYAKTEDGEEIGAYNPKGWASMGNAQGSKRERNSQLQRLLSRPFPTRNARPSPAAFLFLLRDGGEPLKLRSASHIGCNSISSDAPDRGIDFGVEGLCIPLRASEDRGPGSERRAFSKLGVYYEGEGALWGAGQTTALAELKVFAGVYAPGEEYPYAGALIDPMAAAVRLVDDGMKAPPQNTAPPAVKPYKPVCAANNAAYAAANVQAASRSVCDALAAAGVALVHDFISADEEAALLETVDGGAWEGTLSRRVQHYGHRF
ncbi:hypothetical protein AURANDRAFT_68622, partial [Aureococcus anophagefferens]